MSVWAKTWAYEQRCGKVRTEGRYTGKYKGNPTAKSLLVAIAEFADEEGRCWAGQDTLAAMGDMDGRTAREQLAFLENEKGLIRREERRRRDGTRTSDMIYLLAPADRLRPPRADRIEGQNDQTENPAGRHPSTGKLRRDNRKTTADQPAQFSPHEPSVEPSGSTSSLRANALRAGDRPETGDGPPPEKETKPQDLKQYAVAELMRRVNAAREWGSPIHDPLDRDRAQYARFFATRSKVHGVETLLFAFDYMVAKASGELEGEPKAWCGFDTALDFVLAGWRPANPVRDEEERRRILKENAAAEAELLETMLEGVEPDDAPAEPPSPDEIRRMLREAMETVQGRSM